MRNATAYLKSTSGNLAVIAALSSTVMVGAAGFGLDTYRLENTRTMLDQTVGLTCDRIENADYALYPSTEERMAMARVFSADLVKQSKLNPERTKIAITDEDGTIKVAGASTIDATMMKIFGQDKLNSVSVRNCTAPSKAPPTKACTPDDLIYLNPGSFEIAAGTLVGGQRSYAATLYDPRGNIKARQVVGNGSGVTEVFLKSSNVNDMVVVQPFNADGTTPAACNPTIPCKGDTKTCPPPDTPICTRSQVEQMAAINAFYRGYAMRWTESQGLKAALKGTTIQTKKHLIKTVADFEPEVFIPRPWVGIGATGKTDAGQVFLDLLDSDEDWLPQSIFYQKNGAKLYRVVADRIAAWELNGQCVVATSPIVIDLIAKGEIQTTGVSSARYLIPQHRVNATVDFDMGGTGKTIRTEWITGNGQALLVDNRDGKAATDMNGTRLFGNMGGHAHGYLKLATLDANGDSKITGDELTGLAAWIDNGDARVQAGELKTLSDVGVTELSTQMTEVPTGDGGVHMRSTAIMNGKEIMTEDVWFGVDLTERVSAAGAMQSPRVLK